MSCVRETSPPPPLLSEDHLHQDLKKRRFLQPLRGLRRIFRRKGRTAAISADSDGRAHAVNELRESIDDFSEPIDFNSEPAKSHSTSHLDGEQSEDVQQRCLQSTLLSVSHDSVFTSEQRSPGSESQTSLYTPKIRLGFPQSSVRAELFAAVRKRREQESNISDDEDLGLPRSPISNSPSIADDLSTKENVTTKSLQSTCSDGSLLSMGSSEMDEELCYQNSWHSSRLSLYEKHTSAASEMQHNNDRSTNSNSYSSDGDAAAITHNAAKHKMAVKPKRNHGAPHKKHHFISNNSLPTTLEINEEGNQKNAVAFLVRKPITDLKPVCDEDRIHPFCINETKCTEQRTGVTLITVCEQDDGQKPHSWAYSSLPVGVTVSPGCSFELLDRSMSNAISPTTPAAGGNSNNNSYSNSNSNSKSNSRRSSSSSPDDCAEHPSFFRRLLLRRSSKNKKNVIEKLESRAVLIRNEGSAENETHLPRCLVDCEVLTSAAAYPNDDRARATRHHPPFRQRAESLSFVATPCDVRTELSSEGESDLPSTPLNILCKSHSFRCGEKLSCTLPLENSSGLPNNIGSVIAGTLSRKGSDNFVGDNKGTFLQNSMRSDPHSLFANSASAAAFAVLPNNESTEQIGRLSIGVNESNDWAENGRATGVQALDVRIAPVPTPRTSLLNRTSFQSQLAIERTKMTTSSINVIVSEDVYAAGQQSASSICSNDSSEDSDERSNWAIVEPPIAISTVTAEQQSSSWRNEEDDLEDDVFQPCPSQLAVRLSELPGNVYHPQYRNDEQLPSTVTEVGPVVSAKAPNTWEQATLVCEPELSIEPIIVSDLVAEKLTVNDTIVVIRKKTRDVTRSSGNVKKDEEPELMKVFARRSLKLMGTDDALNNDEAAVDGMSVLALTSATTSKDSEKENEDATDEEQTWPKSTPQSTAILFKVEATFPEFRHGVNDGLEKNGPLQLATSTTTEKKLRCKSIPNEMEKVARISSPLNTFVSQAAFEEPTTTTATAAAAAAILPFKRIQQRREEWEKRAQQAMKMTGTR